MRVTVIPYIMSAAIIIATGMCIAGLLTDWLAMVFSSFYVLLAAIGICYFLACFGDLEGN